METYFKSGSEFIGTIMVQMDVKETGRKDVD
jgi:hypothetical protein